MLFQEQGSWAGEHRAQESRYTPGGSCMQGGSQHQAHPAPFPQLQDSSVLGGGAGQETPDVYVMPPMSLGSGVVSPSSQPMARAGQGYT